MKSLDLEYLNNELGTDFRSISDIDWNDISSDPTLKFSDDFINKFDKLIQWVMVSQHKNLSIDFIKKYEDKLCIPLICTYQKLDNELIEKYAESYLHLILNCQTLTIEQIENLIKKYPSKIDWSSILYCQKLTESFIEKYQSHFSLACILYKQNVSEKFIKNNENKIDNKLWSVIVQYQKLSESFIEEEKNNNRFDLYKTICHQTLSESFIEKLVEENLFNDGAWNLVSAYQILSEPFIEKYQDKINWFSVSKYQVLSEPFIEKYIDKLNLDYISRNQKLSETFIEKYQDKVDWNYVSKYQKLSEGFIEKYKDKVNWSYISTYQPLSEHFIKNNVKVYYWNKILTHQQLSEEFIGEMLDKQLPHCLVNNLLSYQKLSDEFIKKYGLKINKNNLWQYKDTEFKKQRLINSGKYECHEDYFIAYKAVREDRYSLFNFQYQYLPGETYESHCDCTVEEDSFGLNVGTYNFAKDYLGYRKGIVIKCKIYYEDIGRIVHKAHKVRCFKITVLE